MGKINKYSNIYDTEGNLIRSVGNDGILHKYTIEELEELVNKLTEDRDEDGNIKNPQALNNASGLLFRMYQEEPGHIHLQKMLSDFKTRQADNATTEEQVEKALTDVAEEVEHTYNVNTLEPDYVDFEEIEDTESNKEEAA